MTLPPANAGPYASKDYLLDLPTELLRQELRARDDNETSSKPTCGSGSNRIGYNTSAHVFALFLILVLSTLGMSIFTLVLARRER